MWTAAIPSLCFAQTETFTLAGRVLNVSSGAPVRRVLVQLDGDPKPLAVLSDDQGAFRFERLSAGDYSLTTSKPGFRLASSQPQTEFQSLTLGPSKTDINVMLEPLASIDGRVLDNDGDPVPQAQIDLFTRSIANGLEEVSTARSVVTDMAGWFQVMES